jgi:hypothetical protein
VKWSALTAPPPVRPPPPKRPLFTTKVFSTKSFGPGHLIGAGALVVGLVGITKLFVARSRAEATRDPESRPTRVENNRGEYGKKR